MSTLAKGGTQGYKEDERGQWRAGVTSAHCAGTAAADNSCR